MIACSNALERRSSVSDSRLNMICNRPQRTALSDNFLVNIQIPIQFRIFTDRLIEVNLDLTWLQNQRKLVVLTLLNLISISITQFNMKIDLK